MKMTRHAPALVIVILVVALMGCRPAGTPEAGASVAPPGGDTPIQVDIADRAGLNAEEVAAGLYEWYIGYYRQRDAGNALANGALAATGYLTDELIEQLKATVAGFGVAGGADPVLCAQDVPDSVQVVESYVEAGRAEVLLGTSFAGHFVQVGLLQVGGQWAISDIRCGVPGPPQEAPTRPEAGEIPSSDIDTARWPVYENGEYGFALRYPADWVYTEHVSSPGQPPIGPENVRLMVLFMPREWADHLARSGPPDPHAPSIAPFSLEVSVGSMEDYRRAYIQPTHSQAVTLGGYAAMLEEEAYSDTARVLRYVVQHPADDTRWLTMIDYTSGFADRLPGNEEHVAQFRAMLQALRFSEETRAAQPDAQADDEYADWQTYSIGRYGFEMRYPPMWTLQEAAVQVGPENPTEVVVTLSPQGWAGAIAPVSVEFSDGPLARYRAIYPEVADGETREIGGQVVLVEPREGDETFYIWSSPSHESYRATVRVNLTGWEGEALSAMKHVVGMMLERVRID
jgi:hypothetical protein